MTQSIESSIVSAVSESGLAPDSGQALLKVFQPLFEQASTLVQSADAIVVTDATQVTEIRKARALRLDIRRVRLEIEKAHKVAKEDSLRTGKAIDRIKRLGMDICEPVEARLQEAEDIAERAEAARKSKIAAERSAIVAAYTDPAFYDLANMAEPMFLTLVEGLKAQALTKIEAERAAREAAEKVEAERVAEAKRIREENERLRLEAEESERQRKAVEAKAKAEREAAEAEARRERELAEANLAKERAHAEAEKRAAAEKARKELAEAEAKAAEERRKVQAQADAYRKAREDAEAALAKQRAEAEAKARAEVAAKKKAAAAPDKAKLLALRESVVAIFPPKMATLEGHRAMDAITAVWNELITLIESEANKL